MKAPPAGLKIVYHRQIIWNKSIVYRMFGGYAEMHVRSLCILIICYLKVV